MQGHGIPVNFDELNLRGDLKIRKQNPTQLGKPMRALSGLLLSEIAWRLWLIAIVQLM